MTAGRPSSFTKETATAICERIAAGESLRTVCADDGMPALSTVFLWLTKNTAFSDQYARAREAQMDAMAEEIVTIADESSLDVEVAEDGSAKANHEVVQRSRLRVDTRKWLMSKLAPKKYGERTTTELTGANGGPIDLAVLTPVEREQRVAAILAKLQAPPVG